MGEGGEQAGSGQLDVHVAVAGEDGVREPAVGGFAEKVEAGSEDGVGDGVEGVSEGLDNVRLEWRGKGRGGLPRVDTLIGPRDDVMFFIMVSVCSKTAA